MELTYKFVGIVTVTLTNEDGTIATKQVYNKVTDTMLTNVSSWLTGTNTSLYPTKIGAGNGSGTISASDTVLWSAISGTLKNVDSTQITNGYYAQYNLTYQTTDPADNYTELGLFDSSNNLWSHVAINVYKSSNQTLTIQWSLYMAPDDTNPSATITNWLRSAVAKWLTGTSNVSGQPSAVIPPTQIQLGTGTGTVAISDTALFTATSGTLKTAQSITQNGYVCQYVYTYLSTDPTGNFTEAGLLDTNGNLWIHGLISGNKTAGLITSVLFQLTITGN